MGTQAAPHPAPAFDQESGDLESGNLKFGGRPSGSAARAGDRITYELACRFSYLQLFPRRFDAVCLRPDPFDAADFAGYWPDRPLLRPDEAIVLRGAPRAGPVPTLSRQGTVLRYVTARRMRYLVDMSGDMERYLQGFSRKSRGTLKRKVNRFTRECGGRPDFRVYRSIEELRAFHRLALPLSRRTYQHRLLDAGLPEDQGFIDRLGRDGEHERAYGYLLFRDGRPISYLYTPIDGRTAYYALLGYAADQAELSPGVVLQYLAFEDLFADPTIERFDFTIGEGQHKRVFANRSVDSFDAVFLQATPRNLAFVASHRTLESTAHLLGRLTARLGLRQTLRKALRRLAARGGEPEPAD
jgi:CelD/BcsL family acetyltransferase involved in cellulose biosynthesis